MHEINYKRLGMKIHDLRKEQGFTQEQLAEIMGISLSFLGHIERGTRVLSVETLKKVCMALHCSADELLETGIRSENTISARKLLELALDMTNDKV